MLCTNRLRHCFFFFLNNTPPTEISPLPLHDALPISKSATPPPLRNSFGLAFHCAQLRARPDRKSTRLNSSHSQISYAVFCLKKKKRTAEVILVLMCCAVV